MAVAVIAVTVIFGLAGAVGVIAAMLLIPRLPKLDDGPDPIAIPFWVPIGIAAGLGAILVVRGAPLGYVEYSAAAMIPLCAAFYTDLRTGLVPDYFTLLPLAFVLALGVWLREWGVLVAAGISFVPFGLAALLSRGRGMGWGDAKLAALGGALVGILPSLLSFGIATFVATAVSAVRYRSKSRPISFAPYLVLAVMASLAVIA